MGPRAIVVACITVWWSFSPIVVSQVDNICSSIETFTITIPQMVNQPVTATYKDYSCSRWYDTCVRTYTINRRKIDYVQVERTRNVDVCCAGYSMEEHFCKAVCTTDCGSNGICSAPETCSCNDGFTLSAEKG